MSSATAGSRPAGQRNNLRDGRKGGKPRGDATAAIANPPDRMNEKKSTSGHPKPPPNPKYAGERSQYASLLNDKPDSDDIEAKVNEVFELTKASKDTIIVALHDSGYDPNRAVLKILEGDYDDNWTEVQMRKSKKDKQEKQPPPAPTKTNEKGTNGTARPHQANRGRNPRQPKAASEPRAPRPHKKDDSTVANNDEKQNANDNERPAKKTSREPREVKKGQSHPVRGRGTRTFLNQQRETNVTKSDEFPNSIDTWSNATVDQNSRPATIAPMAVGNWSDVVSGAAEEWSEEDFDASTKVLETKVFVPSGQPLPVKDEKDQPQIDRLVSKQCDPKQSEISEQNRREAVGAQILQSLKHPPPRTGFSVDQNYINKQAAESIKSLVGIPSATFTGSANSDLPSAKPQRMSTARRSTKIPETAVEMPTSDSVASLGVQFGALDVNFGAPDQNSGYSDIKSSQNSNANTAQVITNKVVSNNSVPVLSTYDQNKGPTIGVGELRTTEEMLKGSGFGAKLSEDSRSSIASKQGKSVMDAVKGGDLYSGSMSNQASNDSGFSKTAPYPYGTQNYSAGATSASYQGSSSYSGQNAAVFSGSNSNYSSNYPSNAASNTTQKNMPGLKDLDASAGVSGVGGQIKHNTNYDLHGASASSIVNSTTKTTNVLQNTGIPNTGNGGKSMNQQGLPKGLPFAPQIHPIPQPYIGIPFSYPVSYHHDPSMQMAPGQDAQTFATAYNPNAAEHKFSRTEGNDANVTTPSATSQAPVVSQQQQFAAHIGTLPPGYGTSYGIYYTIPPQPGIFPGQTPFVPVPAANNAPHASATAPGFAKGGAYPSHSYASSGYDASMTGVPASDYPKQAYGQTANQHQSKPLASGNADLMASQSYGKGHGQVSKQQYEKSLNQSYQASNAFSLNAGSQAGLGAYGTASSYMAVPQMAQGFSENQPSNQRGMGSKGSSGGGGKNPYGQNMYGSQW